MHTLSKITQEKAVLREGWRHPRQSILPSSGPETTQPTQTAVSSHSTIVLQQLIGWVFWVFDNSRILHDVMLHIVGNAGLGEEGNLLIPCCVLSK